MKKMKKNEKNEKNEKSEKNEKNEKNEKSNISNCDVILSYAPLQAFVFLVLIIHLISLDRPLQ